MTSNEKIIQKVQAAVDRGVPLTVGKLTKLLGVGSRNTALKWVEIWKKATKSKLTWKKADGRDGCLKKGRIPTVLA